jgi:tetratricopeptide (TPR) repeat protein
VRKLLALTLLLPFFAGLSSCSHAPKAKELTKEERAALYLDASNAALNDGDTVSAFQHVMRAEKEDPALPEIYHMKGLIYAAKHDYPNAIASVHKALSMNPDFSAANNSMGKLLIDTGKYDEAIPHLLKAANDPLYREAFKALTNLGILYYRRMNYEKSLDEFNQAITLFPEQSCIAYYYRGHLEIQHSNFKDAIRDYDRATRRYCSNFKDAQLALGIAYERNKQYDRARKKFVEIREQFPDTPVADEAVNHLRYLP